jgi:hypothetical protein
MNPSQGTLDSLQLPDTVVCGRGRSVPLKDVVTAMVAIRASPSGRRFESVFQNVDDALLGTMVATAECTITLDDAVALQCWRGDVRVLIDLFDEALSGFGRCRPHLIPKPSAVADAARAVIIAVLLEQAAQPCDPEESDRVFVDAMSDLDLLVKE